MWILLPTFFLRKKGLTSVICSTLLQAPWFKKGTRSVGKSVEIQTHLHGWQQPPAASLSTFENGFLSCRKTVKKRLVTLNVWGSIMGIAEIAVKGPVQKLCRARLWVFCFSGNQGQETVYPLQTYLLFWKLWHWSCDHCSKLELLTSFPAGCSGQGFHTEKASAGTGLCYSLSKSVLPYCRFCNIPSFRLFWFKLFHLDGYWKDRDNKETSHPSHLPIAQKQLLAANTQISIEFTAISVYKWWPTLD